MISILDPTSRIGSDLAEALAERSPELRQRYFHTDEKEEHLILEVAGEAAIVGRLSDPDELAGSNAVVVTAPIPEQLGLTLLAWLRANPGVALLDLSHPGLAGEVAVTVLDSIPASAQPRWFHLVEPALIGPARVVQALGPLDPREVTVTAMRPVSVFGDEALHELAGQAAARLSGATPSKPALLPGHIAFDLAPSADDSAFAAQRQLAALLPGVDAVVHLLDAGIFHGHTATVTVRCGRDADPSEVRKLLRDHPAISLARTGARLEIGDVTRLHDVLCGDIRVAGPTVSAWLAWDGLRLTAWSLGPELAADVSVLVS